MQPELINNLKVYCVLHVGDCNINRCLSVSSSASEVELMSHRVTHRQKEETQAKSTHSR